MSFLVAHDADINAQDDNGDSALLSACRMGRVQVVQKLFLAGADPDLRNNQASFSHKSPHRTKPNHTTPPCRIYSHACRRSLRKIHIYAKSTPSPAHLMCVQGKSSHDAASEANEMLGLPEVNRILCTNCHCVALF